MHPVRFPEPRTQARLRTEAVAVCREFAQQSQSHRRAPKRNDLDHCGQRLLRSYLVKIRCHQVSNQLRHSSCLTSNRVVFEIVSSVATLALDGPVGSSHRGARSATTGGAEQRRRGSDPSLRALHPLLTNHVISKSGNRSGSLYYQKRPLAVKHPIIRSVLVVFHTV